MSGWLGTVLPAAGAGQVFATLAVSVLVVRLLRYVLRLVGLGA